MKNVAFIILFTAIWGAVVYFGYISFIRKTAGSSSQSNTVEQIHRQRKTSSFSDDVRQQQKLLMEKRRDQIGGRMPR